jgi:hypothetical protein
MGIQEVAQTVQKGGTAMATGGGLWAWLAVNAQAIGALCAIIGVALGVAGFCVNLYYQRKKGRA